MNEKVRQYSNNDITVYWRSAKCSHATTCFRELISVFNPGKRPWINMNGAKTEKIIEVVNKCPTDALTFAYNKDIKEPINIVNDTKDEVTPEDIYKNQKNSGPETTITLIKDGPIMVGGEFIIIGEEGNEYKSIILTSFCRCGHSKSQPFCDGNHRNTGFKE